MRAMIGRLASSALTSRSVRDLRRAIHRARRRISGVRPTVHYFHCIDDPYSHLAAQLLARFAARYEVVVSPHLVSPPEDSAAPERRRLAEYGLRDAARVARRFGLGYPANPVAPPDRACSDARAILAATLEAGRFAEVAPGVGAALWSGGPLPDAIRANPEQVEAALQDGDQLRRSLGHYLGAMFYFEGEWYWGVDRLHHLEARLAGLGLDREDRTPMLAPFQVETCAPSDHGRGMTIEYWFSFRSPYSYIALPRIARLARSCGAELRLRYILPMVMRGLPVPMEKRLYIMRDCKREADMVGLPFGKTVDPVGPGVERALAVLRLAIPRGLGVAFAEAALAAAFAEGVDLASDEGLLTTARSAGLSEADVRATLADDNWRAVAEENRAGLFAAGLWGAPTFRVAGLPAHWGQDRIWALEEDIGAAGTSGA